MTSSQNRRRSPRNEWLRFALFVGIPAVLVLGGALIFTDRAEQALDRLLDESTWVGVDDGAWAPAQEDRESRDLIACHDGQAYTSDAGLLNVPGSWSKAGERDRETWRTDPCAPDASGQPASTVWLDAVPVQGSPDLTQVIACVAEVGGYRLDGVATWAATQDVTYSIAPALAASIKEIEVVLQSDTGAPVTYVSDEATTYGTGAPDSAFTAVRDVSLDPACAS